MEEQAEGTQSAKTLLSEIIGNRELEGDLPPLVAALQIKKEQNTPTPEGTNPFCISQFYTLYETIEDAEGELLSQLGCLKPGSLLTGFSVSDELKNSLAQQFEPHFL